MLMQELRSFLSFKLIWERSQPQVCAKTTLLIHRCGGPPSPLGKARIDGEDLLCHGHAHGNFSLITLFFYTCRNYSNLIA